MTSFLHLVAPYDVTIMGENMYPQGSQLELSCSSDGGPHLEYSWSRSGTDEFSNNTITNTSTLTISDLATVDGGDYTCTITNDAGSSSTTVTIYSKLKEICLKATSVGLCSGRVWFG